MNRFTVVIPTRERADTLYHTLRTCIEQDYDDLQILVSDNCSTDDTPDVVKSFNDKRIKYIRTPQRLSMSSNWDFALDHVEGGFVNFIGDDDGLIPGSLKLIDRLLADYNVDAITSKDMAIYFWPGYVDENLKGNLNLSLKPTYRLMDTAKYFEKSFAKSRCVHLPQLYHGYVRTDLLKKIKLQHGNFFNGSSPDIYASVVLGKVLKQHIFSDHPLTIHGLSHHSIGSSNAYKHIRGNASEKFWVENNIPVHPKLEKSGSLTIIYADAFLLARNYVEGIPEMHIKSIIRLAVDEHMDERNEGRRAALLEALEGIAKKNNLEDYYRKLISDQKHHTIKPPEYNYGLNPINEMVVIKTTDIGLQNVYDVFMLCKNILPQQVYSYYERPLNEGLVDYFKRGLRAARRKI
jgi:glycosyltransferase involved in cell wall biosynthesis